jgi:histidinol dehydrogenase
LLKIIKAAEFDANRRLQGGASEAVRSAVAGIIADVIKRGDAAVREYTERFDGCTLEAFEVPPDVVDAAAATIDPGFIEVMGRAALNIEAFHRRQIREGFTMGAGDGVDAGVSASVGAANADNVVGARIAARAENGILLGQRILPLARVGLYVPGGTAAYPSTVLMTCIPAKLAGVGEIVIATPPSKDGGLNPAIAAAAKIAGADRFVSVGGAQAIAALAHGTETIPRVDKICGPGNAYVAEAKRQVFGDVGIDSIAGPSDVLIIADATADPKHIAADMLAQCEHGGDSIAILVTDSAELANKVCAELDAQLAGLPREDIAREALRQNSMAILADNIAQTFEISNTIAPEHLEIHLDNPMQHLGRVKNAGAVFLGKHTPAALGDYYAGPNHTLPTYGAARFASPLSVDDFTKKSSFAFYSEDAMHDAAGDVARFAREEGFEAHARSALARLT